MKIFEDLHPFAKEVWDVTYRYKTEKSIYESFDRCNRTVSEVEKSPELSKKMYDELSALVDNLCPGGRILANLGIPERVATTLHNCFVHNVSDIGLKDPDSIKGIYTMLESQAQTLKSEGGYGSNFSWIRPAGSYIKGIDSRTPGVLAFLQLWDLSSGVVTSGFEGKVLKREEGEKKKIRKGAQMWQLCAWHPEILDFIRAKQTPGRYTKANMSVTITDGFMERLAEEGQWHLLFPRTTDPFYKDEWNGVLRDWKHSFDIYETIPAKSLWEEIMQATYNRNEPGVFFADLANKLDPVSYLNQYIQSTNPCLHGDTLIAVADGRNAVTIKQLAEESKPFDVYTVKDGKVVIGKAIKAFKTKSNTKLIKIVLDDGSSFKATPDHPIMLRDGSYRLADELMVDDELKPFCNSTVKVSSIEESDPADVYDITVPETHNFGIITNPNVLFDPSIGTGVFVHNCGEIPMVTGVCCLGNLILPSFVEKDENGKIYFDWDKFKRAVRVNVRYLDNILDISHYPLPIYKEMSQLYRRIGQGIVGLGSLHYMLGLRYGSEESKKFTTELFKTKAEEEILASAELGREKGNFPLFDKEKFFDTYWWKNLRISEDVRKAVELIGCMRNSHRSMAAPTGNTGVVCNILSGGMEPVFGWAYSRWAIVPEWEIAQLREKGMEIPEKGKGQFFETAHLKLSKRGDEVILKGSFDGREFEFDSNRGLIKEELVEDFGWKFARENYPKEVFEQMQKDGIFVTADELTPDEHLDILAIVSHYTDHACSKTINVKNEIPYEEFKHIYERAHRLEIKGLTTYREGTMTVVLEKEKDVDPYIKLYRNTPGIISTDALLPDKRYSKLTIIEDGINKWYVHTDYVDEKYTIPVALWVNTNSEYEDEHTEVADSLINEIEELCYQLGVDRELVKSQSMKYSHQENVVRMARAIGMALRHKVPIIQLVNILEKYNKNISTFLYHIRKHLSIFIPDQMETGDKCPNCETSNLVYESGCKNCKNCGYSIC